MGIVLLIVLLVVLTFVAPTWGYSANWGPWPASLVGLLLLVLFVLLLCHVVSWTW